MKLATYSDNHYELDSADDRHSETPETFLIPGIETRNNLNVGDLVKLIFRMEDKENPAEQHVERMWVEILQKKQEMYIGRLDNEPISNVVIKADDIISFKAEHVIDIYDDKGTYQTLGIYHRIN